MVRLDLSRTQKQSQKFDNPINLDRVSAINKVLDAVVADLKLVDLAAQERLKKAGIKSTNGETKNDCGKERDTGS